MHKRFLQFDGAKTIMSLLIVFFHYSAMFSHRIEQLPFPSISSVFEYGKYCVEIFFIISGFLIALSYKEKINTMSLHKFLSGRFKVLFFSVFFSVLLGMTEKFLSAVLLSKPNSINLWSVFSSLSMTSAGWIQYKLPFGATSWYVGVLLLCYIIYFFISSVSLKTLSSKRKNIYLTLCMIMVFLGAICIYKDFNFPFLYSGSGRGYCCFFSGVLLYELQNSPNLNKKNLSVISFFVIFALLISSYLWGIKNTFGNIPMGMAVIVAPMITIILLNNSLFSKVLSLKPLLFFSKFNTSLFLTHVPVMGIVYTINKKLNTGLQSKDPIYFLINILIVYAFAILWYYLIEKRVVPKMNKLIKHILVTSQ